MSAVPTSQRLPLQQTFHADALDQIEDCVLAITHDGHIAYANAAVTETLHVFAEDLVGRSLWDAVPALADTEFRRQCDYAHQRRRPVTFEAHAVPYGLWLRVRVVPTHDGMSVYLTDITAARALPDDASFAIEDTTNELLTVLSHELRTPLTCMLGWSDMAMEHDTLELYRQSMPIVHRHARRQERLVANLLDMSKLLHGRLPCHMRPTDLGQLATGIAERMAPIARRAWLSLTVRAGEALPVHADPARIMQCIENLVENSINYSRPGDRILVTCRRVGETVEATIEDTGRGIAPAHMSALFAPLRQANRDEAVGGLGLGLAIARGIAELHDGTLTAASDGPNLGSTFTLVLPLAHKECAQ
jgi:signal transduction histidine kinase